MAAGNGRAKPPLKIKRRRDPAHGARGKIGLRFFSQGGGHGAAIDRAARSASRRAGYIFYCPIFMETRCVCRCRRTAATPECPSAKYFCKNRPATAESETGAEFAGPRRHTLGAWHSRRLYIRLVPSLVPIGRMVHRPNNASQVQCKLLQDL